MEANPFSRRQFAADFLPMLFQQYRVITRAGVFILTFRLGKQIAGPRFRNHEHIAVTGTTTRTTEMIMTETPDRTV